MQVSFKIVQMVNGQMITTKPTDMEAWARSNGRQFLGLNYNPRQRPELQAQPRISGLYGPTWDGEVDGVTVIRYEDSASNDILSR